MSSLEVQQVCECFTMQNGEIQFAFMKALATLKGETYIGKYQQRLSSDRHNEIDATKLTDVMLIPRESYSPPFVDEYTRAPEILPPYCYIKRSDLMSYGEDLSLTRLVSRDIRACEALRLQPHPNVATYYGCQVQENRVTGLCFLQYPGTLMAKINPKHLNNNMFLSEPLEERKLAADRYLPGITQGLLHIHSLGLAHNDINPNNIVIDSEDRPVIIDFDSCLPLGEELDQVKHTPGWYDEKISHSLASNDLDALAEIRTWLTSVSTEDLRFKLF